MYARIRNVIVIGALLILAAGFFRFRMGGGELPVPGGQTEQEVPIEAEYTVRRGDIEIIVSATGSISPAERLPLLFLLPGTVDEVLVEEGETVQADQVLARLDAEDLALAVQDAALALELQQVAYDALTVDPREVDLSVAEAAVYAAAAQLAAAQEPPDARNERLALLQLELAQNQLWQAQLQRDQAELTAGLGLGGLTASPSQAESSVTRAEYEVSIAEQQLQQVRNETPNQVNIASAQAALASAQSALQRLLDGPSETELAIADAQLQTAYLAVEQARYQLSQSELTAPFSGVVSQVNLVEGEPPPTTAAAIELVDNSSFYLDLAVDEIDIAQVTVGQPVEVVLDALPEQPVNGTVTRIADVATDLGGVVTFIVRITLDPTTVPVRVGMSATASILVDEAQDALLVPNRFVQVDRRTGRAVVVVQRPDGTLDEVDITLGRRNETYSEVLSGLNEGDRVVLLPRSFFDPFGFAP